MSSNVFPITDGIWRLSVTTRDILFEGIWPIPNGVTINSYVVAGDKVALVDGVCGWDGVPASLFAMLKSMELDVSDIDYVIVNHVEPDHSGWIDEFRKIRGDDFQLLAGKKGAALLHSFYGIELDRIRVVGDGDSIDLGQGRVLAFAEIPNVHWPDTIATFDTKSGTLMPCDAFGSFGTADNDALCDDSLSEEQLAYFEQEAVRYYSNIVATFSQAAGQAIKKTETLLGDAIKIIAPGHGVVWRKNPNRIIDDYKRYVAYQKGPAKEEVTVVWSSMYGNTAAVVPVIVDALQASGVTVHVHQIPGSHVGDVLASAWTSTGLVFAMPTYEYKMFPPMHAVIDELCKKKVQNRHVFRLGSFGWSGGAQGELDEMVAKYKPGWQFVEPVEFAGRATEADIETIRQRSKELAKRVIESVRGEVVTADSVR